MKLTIRSIMLSAILIVSLLYAVDTTAEQTEKAALKPAVLLTFDDTYVDQWYEAMPVFERYNAKATFFVTRFDELTQEQIVKLKKMKAAGQTIGCHGLRHRKAVEYSQENSLEKYWNNEIQPAIDAMKKEGLDPSCFAYPNSQNNDKTDKLLLGYFSHLRSGVGYSDTEKIFVPTEKLYYKCRVYGTSMDSTNPKMPIEKIFALMDKAIKENKSIVFYGHNIADGTTRLYTTPQRLEKVLKYGEEKGLRFIGLDQLIQQNSDE